VSDERAPYRVPGLTRGFPKDMPLRDRLELDAIIRRRIDEYRAAHGAEPRYVVMDGAAYFVLRFVMGKGEEHVETIHGLTIIVVPVSQMLVVVGEPWEEAARPFQRRQPGGAPR
jgi:hypothetical protein